MQVRTGHRFNSDHLHQNNVKIKTIVLSLLCVYHDGMTYEYIAGFFDGEGTITDIKVLGNRRIRVAIPQTNFEVLDEIKNFCGYGNICNPSKRESHHKDLWIYQVSKIEDMRSFLESIEPYLIVKRKQANEAISFLSKRLLKIKNKAVEDESLSVEIKKLRSSGNSYRSIARSLGICREKARRIDIKHNAGMV